ncbi:MAG: hypothetical protein NVSMB43_06680 [Pseudarthrobacter sp.]
MTDDFIGKELTDMPNNLPPSHNGHRVGTRNVNPTVVGAGQEAGKVPLGESGGMGRSRKRSHHRVWPNNASTIGRFSQRDTYSAAGDPESFVPKAP